MSQPSHQPSPGKRWITHAGRLMMILSLGYLSISLYQSYDDIPTVTLSARTVAAFLLGTAMCILINALGALSWSWLIGDRSAGSLVDTSSASSRPLMWTVFGIEGLRFTVAFRIWARANIAKYLPGNVFHYAGRFAMTHRLGFPTGQIVISMVLEAALLCIGTALVIGFGMAVGAMDISRMIGLLHDTDPASIGVLLVVTAATLLATFLSIPSVRHAVRTHLSHVTTGQFTAAVVGYICTHLLMGATALILLSSLWQVEPEIGLMGLSAGFALAFLLGYLIPGAPGGIGIREVVIVTMFSSSVGTGAALGLAVILRLLTVLGDLLSFSITMLIRGPRS